MLVNVPTQVIKPKRSHRGIGGLGAFKRDVNLLTCILRLRYQAPVAFKTIADVLLETWPVRAKQLVEKCVEEELAADAGATLSEYIESIFDWAQQECSGSWDLARTWDSQEVQTLIRLLGFDGYEVMDDKEVMLQINWRREEDWRAGSILLGRPSTQSSLVSDE